MNNNIQWKNYPIETEHAGVTLRGEIVYWSKDYRVIIKDPINAESKNLHMMYMIPARFVTPLDTDRFKNVNDIDIVEDAIDKLKKLFDDYYSNNK